MGQVFLDASGELRTDQAAPVSTTDATVTTIATIPISPDTINYIRATVLAQDSSGGGSVYVVRARIKDIAGTTTSHDVTAEYTSEDTAGWDATISVSGNNALITVQGAAATNIDWKTTYRLETLS